MARKDASYGEGFRKGFMLTAEDQQKQKKPAPTTKKTNKDRGSNGFQKGFLLGKGRSASTSSSVKVTSATAATARKKNKTDFPRQPSHHAPSPSTLQASAVLSPTGAKKNTFVDSSLLSFETRSQPITDQPSWQSSLKIQLQPGKTTLDGQNSKQSESAKIIVAEECEYDGQLAADDEGLEKKLDHLTSLRRHPGTSRDGMHTRQKEKAIPLETSLDLVSKHIAPDPMTVDSQNEGSTTAGVPSDALVPARLQELEYQFWKIRSKRSKFQQQQFIVQIVSQLQSDSEIKWAWGVFHYQFYNNKTAKPSASNFEFGLALLRDIKTRSAVLLPMDGIPASSRNNNANQKTRVMQVLALVEHIIDSEKSMAVQIGSLLHWLWINIMPKLVGLLIAAQNDENHRTHYIRKLVSISFDLMVCVVEKAGELDGGFINIYSLTHIPEQLIGIHVAHLIKSADSESWQREALNFLSQSYKQNLERHRQSGDFRSWSAEITGLQVDKADLPTWKKRILGIGGMRHLFCGTKKRASIAVISGLEALIDAAGNMQELQGNACERNVRPDKIDDHLLLRHTLIMFLTQKPTSKDLSAEQQIEHDEAVIQILVLSMRLLPLFEYEVYHVEFDLIIDHQMTAIDRMCARINHAHSLDILQKLLDLIAQLQKSRTSPQSYPDNLEAAVVKCMACADHTLSQQDFSNVFTPYYEEISEVIDRALVALVVQAGDKNTNAQQFAADFTTSKLFTSRYIQMSLLEESSPLVRYVDRDALINVIINGMPSATVGNDSSKTKIELVESLLTRLMLEAVHSDNSQPFIRSMFKSIDRLHVEGTSDKQHKNDDLQPVLSYLCNSLGKSWNLILTSQKKWQPNGFADILQSIAQCFFENPSSTYLLGLFGRLLQETHGERTPSSAHSIAIASVLKLVELCNQHLAKTVHQKDIFCRISALLLLRRIPASYFESAQKLHYDLEHSAELFCTLWENLLCRISKTVPAIDLQGNLEDAGSQERRLASEIVGRALPFHVEDDSFPSIERFCLTTFQSTLSIISQAQRQDQDLTAELNEQLCYSRTALYAFVHHLSILEVSTITTNVFEKVTSFLLRFLSVDSFARGKIFANSIERLHTGTIECLVILLQRVADSFSSPFSQTLLSAILSVSLTGFCTAEWINDDGDIVAGAGKDAPTRLRGWAILLTASQRLPSKHLHAWTRQILPATVDWTIGNSDEQTPGVELCLASAIQLVFILLTRTKSVEAIGAERSQRLFQFAMNRLRADVEPTGKGPHADQIQLLCLRLILVQTTIEGVVGQSSLRKFMFILEQLLKKTPNDELRAFILQTYPMVRSSLQ